jgi:hypothetical protein
MNSSSKTDEMTLTLVANIAEMVLSSAVSAAEYRSQKALSSIQKINGFFISIE